MNTNNSPPMEIGECRWLSMFKCILAGVMVLAVVNIGWAALVSPHNLRAVAEEVAAEVGQVREAASQGKKGPIFVFEEFHTSRVGRMEVATMLLRLHERYGLSLIGLEGGIQRSTPLDATWFHQAGGVESKIVREEAALRMLGEGEINSGEFITLVFPRVKVRGIELEEQYKKKLDVKGNPAVAVLLRIAEQKLTQSAIRRVNDLLEAGKTKEALEIIKNSDPWVKSKFAALDAQDSVSCGDMMKNLQDILAKAGKESVPITAEQRDGIDKTVEFFRMCDERSRTMCEYMLRLIDSTGQEPSAMIIGAAHTTEVASEFRRHGVTFVVLRARAFNPDSASMSMDQFDLKNNRKWSRTTNGTLGRLLNAQRNPPPVIETATAKSYASACMAAMVVSEAAGDGKRVPEDVRPRLSRLPEIRFDYDSFELNGFDVTFRMWLRTTDDKEKEVWVRTGTLKGQEQAKTLEQKLLQRIADLGGGGGKLPPRDPPPGTEGSKDKEGPGDGHRKGVLISRVGMQSLAVFAENKAKANEVGRLSG